MTDLLWLDYVSYTVLTFASYAFSGWMLETLYRSFTQQQIVNPIDRFFHLQLWDYCDTPLNLQGQIALPFSLLWGVLGLIFANFIHPHFGYFLLQVPVDIFRQDRGRQSQDRFVLLFQPFRRLLSTYPKLRHMVNETVSLLQSKQDSVEQFVKRQSRRILGQINGD